MSETPATPRVTGKMFLFERPELLNKEQHGAYGLSRPEKPFGFCAKIRGVPLTVSEIPAAMKHYPVVFSGLEKMTPIAVLGIYEDVNLFVNEAGEWEENVYVPGYLRRYPFAFASETGGDRFAVVVDAAYDGFTQNPEVALFENGEPSEAMRNAIEFCKQYEQDRRNTDQAMQIIEPMKLVVGQSAQYTPQQGGDPVTFAQYFGVDEKLLAELPDEKFLELRRTGLLPIIYAQLMSMANWRLLLMRRARRYNLQGEAVVRPLSTN